MSEVERHNLFSRFKKQERRKNKQESATVQLQTDAEITAENQDHLNMLQRQFELLDLDPYIAQLQADIYGITQSMESYEGIKNEVGLDVWEFNIAVPGKLFDQDTSIRAARGIAFQLFYERPDLAMPDRRADYSYGIASTVPFFDEKNPTFFVFLYSPTSQLVDTAEGKELAGVAPAHLFIGTDFSEGRFKGNLLNGIGISQAARERDLAHLDHAQSESRRLSQESIIASREGFENVDPWMSRPFVWNQEVVSLKEKRQVELLDNLFGIRTELTAPKMFRQRKRVFVKGSGREDSRVFFPEAAGVVKSQIDREVWDFLKSQPMYALYLESPFSEDR